MMEEGLSPLSLEIPLKQVRLGSSFHLRRCFLPQELLPSWNLICGGAALVELEATPPRQRGLCYM